MKWFVTLYGSPSRRIWPGRADAAGKSEECIAATMIWFVELEYVRLWEAAGTRIGEELVHDDWT
jgi:hypothetical protein